MKKPILVLLTLLALAAAACSSDTTDATDTAEATDEATEESADTSEDAASSDTTSESSDESDEAETTSDDTSTSDATDTAGATDVFQIDVWADNWMAVYVDGVLIGEDSVPITTERSFNSETFTFEAALPFTLAIEAKDYKETDSGLEYIGESNQQMGDGGIIAQITDSTGNLVAVTSADWQALVVHQAPLNTDCEGDADPDATCEFAVAETPAGWTSVDFDSSAWGVATEWSAEAVDPKIGYDDIDWDGSAALIWGSDLEVDNTVLLRTVVSG